MDDSGQPHERPEIIPRAVERPRRANLAHPSRDPQLAMAVSKPQRKKRTQPEAVEGAVTGQSFSAWLSSKFSLLD